MQNWNCLLPGESSNQMHFAVFVAKFKQIPKHHVMRVPCWDLRQLHDFCRGARVTQSLASLDLYPQLFLPKVHTTIIPIIYSHILSCQPTRIWFPVPWYRSRANLVATCNPPIFDDVLVMKLFFLYHTSADLDKIFPHAVLQIDIASSEVTFSWVSTFAFLSSTMNKSKWQLNHHGQSVLEVNWTGAVLKKKWSGSRCWSTRCWSWCLWPFSSGNAQVCDLVRNF